MIEDANGNDYDLSNVIVFQSQVKDHPTDMSDEERDPSSGSARAVAPGRQDSDEGVADIEKDPVEAGVGSSDGDNPAAATSSKRAKITSYSIDFLLSVREKVSHVDVWPEYLDDAYKNQRGKWDPDRWHQNRKRGSTPPPGEERPDRDRERDRERRPTRGSGAAGEERPNSSLSSDGRVKII